MTALELVAAEKAVAHLKDYIEQRGWRRARRNQQVRDACAVPELIWRFVDKLLSRKGEVDDSLRGAVRGDGTYVEVFGKVGAAAGEFQTCLATFDGVRDPAVESELVDRLTDLADEMLRMFGAALDALETAVNAKADTRPEFYGAAQQTVRSFAYDMRLKVQVRQAILRSTRRALDAPARRNVDQQLRAHRHYTEIEHQEGRAADRLGRMVVALLAAVAVSLVVVGVSAGGEIVRTILFLGAAVPLLMLAGFLGLRSSWHRCTAQWARERLAVVGPVDADVPGLTTDASDPATALPTSPVEHPEPPAEHPDDPRDDAQP